MYSLNLESEKILNYIKENIIGLILLFVALLIIYFVDYVNRLNSLLYSTPSPINNLTSLTSSLNTNINKRKFKKR